MTGPAVRDVVTRAERVLPPQARRVMGRRRVKTDAIDLEAITELLLASRGAPSRHGRR